MFEKLFNCTLDEFRQGAIRFAGTRHVELVILLAAIAILAAWYVYYRRSPVGLRGGVRVVLWLLRGLALALLVIILFHLVLRVPLPETSSVFLAVLADDSRSMRIEDAGVRGAKAAKADRRSRLAVAKELLGVPGNGKGDNPGDDEEGLLAELADICPVRLYKFGPEARRIRDVRDVTGTGERTNLFAALEAVATDLRSVPVAGVVIVTDGAQNAGGDPLEVAKHMKVEGRPVYCVGLGEASPPNDYEVIRVQAPREVRANTSVDVYANVRTSGFTQPFKVILRKGGENLAEVTVPVVEDADVYRVRLGYEPKEKGTFRYTVEIPPHPDEVILDNNRYEFIVKIADKRLPVLYLEGSPREEYRFLRRALFRDKDFRIASILRLEGPKEFILQGTETEDGLENGYPTKAEHLFRFEAVIIGDVEAAYLTKKQREITEKFVRERGGGFLMLGGVNSFNLGQYQGTVIAKMLPVALPPPSVGYKQVEFGIRLTDAGYKHPILQQSSNLLFNRNVWSRVPTLIGFNPIPADHVKPGAQILAENAKTGEPLLVVQNYGAGRTGAFTTGGSWHWQMAKPREDEMHEKFWKQMVRWLAVGAKAKLTIELDKDIFARRETVAIRATVLDRVLKPDNNAKVIAKVTDPFSNTQELPMRCVLSVEGVYDAQYEPLDVGDYKIEVQAELADGTKTAAVTTFSVGETLDEFSDAGQKTALLAEIAAVSGGKYFKPEQAGEIPEHIRQRVLKMKTERTVHDNRDIWDTPLLFAILVVALSAEWFIRRRVGLM